MSLSVKINGREVDLEQYYRSNPQLKPKCNNKKRTYCLGLTPYNLLETFNYGLKMLVLPGIIAGIIIFLLIVTTGPIDNLILITIISILTYIGNIFIFFYAREQCLTRQNKIEESDQVKEIPVETDNIIETTLNPITAVVYKIGFVGDIMMMRDFELRFNNDVIKFFKDDGGVDIVIGNLEGIVREPWKDPYLSKQAHPLKILNQLNCLLRGNTRWLLCLSNNHSIDFSNYKFHKSLNHIQSHPKIDVFGRNDVPNVIVKGLNINIASASEWSNQKTWKCISKYRTNKLEPYFDNEKFNILYPHWNFENERYVRKRLQKRAKKLLIMKPEQKWDLIFGHHTHVRQPVIKVREDYIDDNGESITDDDNNPIVLWKLVAFSGGNFTSGVKWLRRKKHIHGRIMRCNIGPFSKDQTRLAVGKVQIVNTVNKEDYERDTNTDVKNVKFGVGEKGVNRLWIFVIGIAIVLLVIFLRIFGIY